MTPEPETKKASALAQAPANQTRNDGQGHSMSKALLQSEIHGQGAHAPHEDRAIRHAFRILRSAMDHGWTGPIDISPESMPTPELTRIAKLSRAAFEQGREGYAELIGYIYEQDYSDKDGLRQTVAHIAEPPFPERPQALESAAQAVMDYAAKKQAQLLTWQLSDAMESGEDATEIIKALAEVDYTPPAATENLDEREPFPMECLPGVAGEMAREIGRVTTSQCEALAAAAVIGTLSASIGAGIVAGSGGERQVRGNLYVLAIADSGTGKGEAYSLAAKPFEALEAEEIAKFDFTIKPRLTAKLNIAKARADKLCKLAANENDTHARQMTTEQYRLAEEELAGLQREIEGAPRWKVADVTREQLAVIIQGQPGEAVASMSSEARGIFSIVKGRYGKEGGDEDLYCSGYSGDSITVDRVSRPRVTLSRPCLSVLWMVQPDAARRAFADENMTESGLLPRCLIFDPKAQAKERFEHPEPIPEGTKEAWASLIGALVDYRRQGSEPRTVTVSKEAIAILADYERECVRRRRDDGDLRDIKSFVARWAENAWRLGVVLHAAKHGSKAQGEQLDGQTAESAVKIMQWFADRQLEILSAGRSETRRKRLLALLALLAEAKGEISIRDLRRNHGFEKEEIKQLQETFPKSFRIYRKQPEIGRPSDFVTNLLEDK